MSSPTMSAANSIQMAADSPNTETNPTNPRPSRYESQKRRDWHTFGQYLRNHRPPLELSRCSGAHVLEFLRYLDQFGKTKVHAPGCPFFGHPAPPAPCPCPLKQAWGSLDALVGRLRAAFEEHGGRPEANPFGARAVRLYLREVRDSQAKARGIAYEKKRRKRPSSTGQSSATSSSSSSAAAAALPTPAAVMEHADHKRDFGGHHHGHGHDLNSVIGAGACQHHHRHVTHFLDGHFLMPLQNEMVISGGGSDDHSGASGGDEVVMAMAAAEAHAAGCLLPLSVFN